MIARRHQDRRLLPGVTAGLALAACNGAAPRPRAGEDIYAGHPLIARNAGRWDGTYRFVRPNGELLEQYDFRIRVSLSRDNARAYRQESHYRWPDGRTRALVFEAAYVDGELRWDDGRIHGRLWQISDETAYLVFGFHAEPALRCHEMIQTPMAGQTRGRSWLWYRNDLLERYTLIDERRVADHAPLEYK
ncbi:MAG: hypothetical protein D6727_09090 [Gammaproteobacteria bacterium]|nr:MAG: hypothetical protein D6727_09090 [Gammaproteobacteria bacterium]